MSFENAASDGTRILVLGNCQAGGLAACLKFLMPRNSVIGLHWHENEKSRAEAAAAAAEADLVVSTAPTPFIERIVEDHGFDAAKLLPVPILFFNGFHPDLVEAFDLSKAIPGVNGAPYQSAIGVWCWRNRIAPEKAVDLFSAETMRRLGYDRTWPQAVARTRDIFAKTDIPFASTFLPMQSSGALFMHTYNHPTLEFIAALARSIARRLGAPEADLAIDVASLVPDALVHDAVWPVYPGVAEALGLPSSLVWKYGHNYYDVRRYLEAQYAALDLADGPVICPHADSIDPVLRQITA